MNNDFNSSLVNLSIPQSVTQPIVAAKIQEAITIALGGADKIVESVVHTLCNTKVDSAGSTKGYESDRKISWIDYHVTQLLQDSIKEELKKQLGEYSSPIKEALLKELRTKQGQTLIAKALLAGLEGSFASSYTSKVEVKFESKA